MPLRVLTGPDILQFQELARQVVIAEEIARYAVRLVDASRPGPARRAGVHRQVGEVGRRPARVAGAGARREGARADARSLSRVDQGHSGAREADPAPSHHDELLRRVRAHQLRTRSSSGCSTRCRCRRAGCKWLDRRRRPASGSSSIPRSSRASARSSSRRARSSKDFSPGCTAVRSRASASSSPSTASTFPATISRRSTGRSTRAAIATTSRNSRRRPTSTAT